MTFLTGVPRPWTVMPLPVVFFAWSGYHPVVSILPISFIACIITTPIVFGVRRVSWWMALLSLLALATGWTYFGYGYSYAMSYHGSVYAMTCASINAIVTGALIVLWWRTRRRSSFWHACCFCTALAWWASSYAFAYLGELP